VAGNVRIFDAPVSIDNTPGGTPVDAKSSSVATLVEINIPKGLGREALIAQFSKAAPAYQQVAGLLRKQFILSDQGTFGGVYLWKDQASADNWFNRHELRCHARRRPRLCRCPSMLRRASLQA
jgi:hypothetical protein